MASVEPDTCLIRGVPLDDNNRIIGDIWHFPTYCGTEKPSVTTTYHLVHGHKPVTCLGCILVRFQELAESKKTA